MANTDKETIFVSIETLWVGPDIGVSRQIKAAVMYVKGNPAYAIRGKHDSK